MGKTFDFGGYATKFNLKCSDGRIIHGDAFKDCDGKTVPLVWMHLRKSPDNVLGHALLERRSDGMYAHCSFNDTEMGRVGKEIVQHGDITSLSIYANDLVQRAKTVVHGAIREVSLVLSGANPGAHIDNLAFQHDDGSADTIVDDEAIIYGFENFQHSDEPEDDDEPETDEEPEEDDGLEHADAADGEETVEDVFNTLTDKQKNVVVAMIGAAVEEAEASIEHSNTSDEGENTMKFNVFSDQNTQPEGAVLTHAQFDTILETSKKLGSFRAGFLAHADDYGITDIEILFPDARNVTPTPDMITREMNWVQGVLNGCKHSPFSRIKSIAADITADEARAKGYIKGKKKTEEVIKLLKRTTSPQTIYKKQKLDRDDIIDITDMDVVAWIKAEMRIMLNEEIARAVLVGDGRNITDPDKIQEDHVRPIYTDDDIYAYHVRVQELATPAETTVKTIESIIRNRVNYKGSGNPTMFTTSSVLADMLLLTDSIGRRLYNTEAELAALLRVRTIVEVPVMENLTREVELDEGGTEVRDLTAIIVNLSDYTIGADKGGEINFFEDFDIDYNQEKYLLETRISGSLTHPQSALVIETVVA